MPMTTRSQIPAEVNYVYNRALLMRAVPSFLWTLFAQVKGIPQNSGTSSIKFRRYSNLSAATTPLTEGVTPDGSQLSSTEVTAVVAQYGDFVTVTDVLTYESQDSVLMEATDILGDQFADTVDQLTRDILAACTSVTYAGLGNVALADVAAGDVATLAHVKAAVLILKTAKAKKLKRMVNPSTGVATQPVRDAFVGINHTNISATIAGFTGFIPVQNYPSQMDVMPGEYGMVNEVRFLETTNGKVHTGAGTGAIDLYSIVIMASDAYGTSTIDGKAIENIIHPPGSAGTADPLNQRATSGWKATFVAKILNEDFITRIVCALT